MRDEFTLTGAVASPRLAGRLAPHAVLAIALVFTLGPIVWMVGMSLKQPQDVLTNPLNPLPLDPTLANYRAVFDASDVVTQLRNSLVFAGGVTLGHLAIAVPAAYAFARWSFRGAALLFGSMVFTLSVPFVVTYLPNFVLLSRTDQLNTYQGLILPQMATGYGIFLLTQHFRSFPLAIFDAARVDGATEWQVLVRILLPAMRAPILAVGLFIFISTWNELVWPLLVATDPGKHVLTVGLTQFSALEGGTQFGPLMAAALTTALPTLVLYWFFRRQVLSVVHDGALN